MKNNLNHENFKPQRNRRNWIIEINSRTVEINQFEYIKLVFTVIIFVDRNILNLISSQINNISNNKKMKN